MTNADKIRAMTDEELAKFIPSGPCPPSRWHRDGFGARYTECPNEERFHGCRDCWLDWLKQEIPSTPPPPLCPTCSHANMSVTDDFADCLCAVSGGCEGGRTECKDYLFRGEVE